MSKKIDETEPQTEEEPKKEKPQRGRNWAVIVYKESLPEGEPDKTIEEIKVPCLYIWHDMDEEDGKKKKEHAHIVLMFDGNKSFEQVKAITDNFGGTVPIRIENLRSMARYLVHADSPSKYQYNKDDVIEKFGADFKKLFTLPADRYDVIREMIEYVNGNDIRYYSDLLSYCAATNEKWFRALCDNCREDIYRYIYSRASKLKAQEEEEKEKKKRREEFDYYKYPPKHSPTPPVVCDSETGELLEELEN